MKCMFLDKFFLAFRTMTIRKEICGIRQHFRETLHKYWERFNKLCATCPYHQINEQLLIQYFYEGLIMMDRNMIDAASGGALMIIDNLPEVWEPNIITIQEACNMKTLTLDELLRALRVHEVHFH
ncbi:hypothetical protein CR513_19648, partial [Mucuna pruriens]